MQRSQAVPFLHVVLGVVALCSLSFTEARAASKPFTKLVPGNAVPVSFINIVTFKTPTGVGVGRTTIIKVVTANSAGLTFLLRPKTAGTIAARSPLEFTLGGASGIIEEMGADVVANAVLAATTPLPNSPAPSPPAPAGLIMVKVTIQYDDAYNFPAQEDWFLDVKETTAAQEYFGFAGDTDAEATKAAIEAVDSLNFGEVQVGLLSHISPVQKVDVRNIGTAPLEINALPIAGTHASVFSVVSTGIPPKLDPGEQLPNVFDEMQSPAVKTGIWIDARPAAAELGPVSPSPTLSVEAAGADTKTVTLNASGVNLYADLLFDVSGSMSWRPDGSNSGVPEAERRLTFAKDAARQIVHWTKEFSSGRAFEGLATFPGPVSNGTSEVREAIGQVQVNSGNLLLLLGGETAGGLTTEFLGTPMEAGIVTTMNDMDTHLPVSAAKRPLLRQAILLLSDGAENEGSNARNQITPLRNKGIRLYTVGYGKPGSADVDHGLLNDLAVGTSGKFFDANSLNAFDLKAKFKQAVQPWLNLRAVVDPVGQIRRAQSRSHAVCIDDVAHGVTFTVDWDRRQQGAIDFQLRAPSGEVITPASPNVFFAGGDTFAMYVIRGARVRGGRGAGEWTLRLNGSAGLPANADTTYSYNVLVQSPVAATPSLKAKFLTLEKAVLELYIGDPVYMRGRQMQVALDYDVPAASFNTYLARTPIDPKWVFPRRDIATPTAGTGQAVPAPRAEAGRVPDTIMGEPASIAQRKTYALQKLVRKPFVDRRKTGTVSLVDDGTAGDKVAGDGIFAVTLPVVAHDGIHGYVVNVREIKPVGRGCITREINLSRLATIAVNAKALGKHLTLVARDKVPRFDPRVAEIQKEPLRPEYTRQWVMVAPQDESGNYAGVGLADQIRFVIKDGEAASPIIDNWDGSYVQAVDYRSGAKPSVAVAYAGVVSPPKPLSGLQ